MAGRSCKVWVIADYHSVKLSCLLMADLEFRFHPLGCEGPDGEDDEAKAWLDGNRPIYWNEEGAARRQSDRHPDRVRDGKDDRLGLLEAASSSVIGGVQAGAGTGGIMEVLNCSHCFQKPYHVCHSPSLKNLQTFYMF